MPRMSQKIGMQAHLVVALVTTLSFAVQQFVDRKHVTHTVPQHALRDQFSPLQSESVVHERNLVGGSLTHREAAQIEYSPTLGQLAIPALHVIGNRRQIKSVTFDTIIIIGA